MFHDNFGKRKCITWISQNSWLQDYSLEQFHTNFKIVFPKFEPSHGIRPLRMVGCIQRKWNTQYGSSCSSHSHISEYILEFKSHFTIIPHISNSTMTSLTLRTELIMVVFLAESTSVSLEKRTLAEFSSTFTASVMLWMPHFSEGDHDLETQDSEKFIQVYELTCPIIGFPQAAQSPFGIVFTPCFELNSPFIVPIIESECNGSRDGDRPFDLCNILLHAISFYEFSVFSFRCETHKQSVLFICQQKHWCVFWRTKKRVYLLIGMMLFHCIERREREKKTEKKEDWVIKNCSAELPTTVRPSMEYNLFYQKEYNSRKFALKIIWFCSLKIKK